VNEWNNKQYKLAANGIDQVRVRGRVWARIARVKVRARLGSGLGLGLRLVRE
jgi:hypothetical protein